MEEERAFINYRAFVSMQLHPIQKSIAEFLELLSGCAALEKPR